MYPKHWHFYLCSHLYFPSSAQAVVRGTFPHPPQIRTCHPKPTNLPTSIQLPWSPSIDLGNEQSVYHLYIFLAGRPMHCCTRSVLGLPETHASGHPNFCRIVDYAEVSACFITCTIQVCHPPRLVDYAPHLDLSSEHSSSDPLHVVQSENRSSSFFWLAERGFSTSAARRFWSLLCAYTGPSYA